MTTQVVFQLDKKVKDKAMRRAKREGVPFAAVMKIAAQEYAQERYHIGMLKTERLNEKTQKELKEIMQDIKKGRNISPGFENMEDAIAWLERKDKK